MKYLIILKLLITSTVQAQTVINSGGTYSGNYINESGIAIIISTEQPVIIENSLIKASDHLIKTATGGTDITIRNCTMIGLDPTEPDKAYGRAGYFQNSSRLIIENNHMDNTSGFYLLTTADDAYVRIRYNYAKNINGWHLDRKGYEKRQFVQFNKVRNVIFKLGSRWDFFFINFDARFG